MDDHRRFAGILLCGGKSRRMGKDKYLLDYKGRTFLELLLGQMAFCDPLLLAAGSNRITVPEQARTVPDYAGGAGPMAGLCGALSQCERPAALVVACDMPLFHERLGRWLCAQLRPEDEAVVPYTADGRHPLCAVYRAQTCCQMQRRLLEGDNCLQRLLEELQVRYVSVPQEWENCFQNVNTKDDYAGIL